MPKLSPQTVTLLDGDIRLMKRVTTKCRKLDDAKRRARELCVEHQVRQRNGLPVISKRFADVARVVIADMEKQLEAGAGKVTWRDYKLVLERFLVVFITLLVRQVRTS